MQTYVQTYVDVKIEELKNWTMNLTAGCCASSTPPPCTTVVDDFTGWNSATTGQISGAEAIHGPYGNPGDPTLVSKTFSNLPAHASLKVKARYYSVGSWDVEADPYLNVDGAQVWTARRHDAERTCTSGNGMWTRLVGGGYPTNTAVNTECYIDIETTVAHSGSSVTLAFFGQLDETIPNESWAFSNVVVTPCS